MPRVLWLAVAAAAILALAIAAWLTIGRGETVQPANVAADRGQPLALFTSLPIYWGETHDLGAMIGGKAARHWARTAIERERPLRPLDTLDADALAASPDLLLIQPRPLSPDENVALDAWVAQGGRVLLFADPALTQDSAFAIGDPRRHQDVVLLSPILARWGLTLEFDEDQRLGERTIRLADGNALPVNLSGRFASRSGGRGDAKCRIGDRALIADCRIGAGHMLAIADAALFEIGPGAASAQRQASLRTLLQRAFADRVGDFAGD